MGVPAVCLNLGLFASACSEMTIREFLHLPAPPTGFGSFGEVAEYMRRLHDVVRPMRRGKIECVTELTLTANAASTALIDPRLSIQSVVVFDPMTATAATALYGANVYVLEANRGNGTWTVTHNSTADVDRKFRIAIIG